MDSQEEAQNEEVPKNQMSTGQEEEPQDELDLAGLEENQEEPETPAPIEAEQSAPEEKVAAAVVVDENLPEVEEIAEYQEEPKRSGSRTALIAFIVVLVLGVVLVAIFQFNRGLSLPSGLSSLFAQSQTTESGLQFEETSTGSGEAVRAGDAVTVHYTGWLEDGTEFDLSVSRGEPFSFIVGYGFVIPGWDEGVMGMQAGGSRRLTIPPDLAYGEAGAGDLIPPNATLVFDVELLEFHTTDFDELVEGEGTGVEGGNTVTVEYTVWLMDGTEIDLSRASGQPIVFTVGAGQMLPGIEQGVTGMKVGGKRLVTIPPELAFGEQGLADLIPPGATLQFEFELVSVE